MYGGKGGGGLNKHIPGHVTIQTGQEQIASEVKKEKVVREDKKQKSEMKKLEREKSLSESSIQLAWTHPVELRN